MKGLLRIQKIAGEVSELHPLLNELFRAMDIGDVFYTHGPNELGADFLVQRFDPSINLVHWIGVVAKLGTIKQDHSDVERQIEECFVPRLSPRGDAQVTPSEVWIACTGNITDNARKKIVEKYRGRKIHFFPGDSLAGLIDTHLPGLGNATSIELQRYRDGEIDNFDKLESRTALVPGNKTLYVCPDITELRVNGGNEFVVHKRYSSLVEIKDLLKKHNFTLIEGGMGSGKSRLLREIAKDHIASDDFAIGKVLPIYVTCIDLKANFNFDINSYVNKRIETIQLNEKPTVLFFLDGLDEIKLSSTERAEALRNLIAWAHSSKEHRLVLSTRPIDTRDALGPTLQNICLARIERMRGAKALAFFKTICGDINITNRVVKDLANSHLLRAFDASPIAYTLLAKVMTDTREEVPASIPELFSKYFELVLGRWEVEKGLIKQKEFNASEACAIIIARSLLESDRVEMPRQELERIIGDYVAPRRHMETSTERVMEILIGRSLVLFHDDEHDVIGFRHKSFSEYFYALGLFKSNNVEIRPDAFSPFWVGVYYFLAGLKRDCPELILSLAKLNVEKNSSSLLRLVNFGNILQAAYETPTASISEALQLVLVEASELFTNVKQGVEVRNLGDFSVMQLLALFRYIVADIYGYPYFKPALEDVTCNLGSDEPTDIGAIALFFALLAHAEADGKLDFDLLITQHGDMLPLELKLAIRHEAKKFSASSKLLKKMERNLKSNLSAKLKGGSSQIITRLYKKPIRKS